VGGREVLGELGVGEGAPIIVHVGRLCPSKGQHLLIEAASTVLRRHPDARFLFVGEDLAEGGRYRSELERLARDQGVDKACLFLGRRDDVPELLASATALVLPSTIEGLPLVLLEAMAAGRPVVASRVDGNAELVVNDRTGILVSLESTRIAAAIDELLNDPVKCRRMGEEGRQRVSRDFSPSAMLDRTFAIYDRVLSSVRGSKPVGERERSVPESV
jgi:glycosyltransferase involved in cell wall biosynthesis